MLVNQFAFHITEFQCYLSLADLPIFTVSLTTFSFSSLLFHQVQECPSKNSDPGTQCMICANGCVTNAWPLAVTVDFDLISKYCGGMEVANQKSHIN